MKDGSTPAPAASVRATRPVVTLGETMALITGARLGSLAHVGQAHVSIGGAESNVAVGLSRLGVPVRWIGRVGDDSLGRRVVRELRAEQIDVRARLDEHAATGLMLKELTGPGTARVYYYRAGSAGSRLAEGDLAPGAVEDAAVLHLTGITPLLSDSARRACRAALARAAAAGVPVSFDVNYRRALAPPEQATEVLREFADAADLLFGSAEELAMMLGTGDPAYEAVREAACARARDGRRVIAKLGEEGAAVLARDEEVRVPGHAVSVVDTVGAGDSFVAGYLSGVISGWSASGCLVRANACGAYTCTAPGDWEGAPTLRELEGFGAAGADPVLR